MTSYVLLQKVSAGQHGDEPMWRQGATVDAVSTEAAIRKAVDGEKGGTFAAVPLRSFQEVTVTVETKRTLRLA